ncbi:MAG: hypothetical protein K6347_00070 [Campylobacterales bacterium]
MYRRDFDKLLASGKLPRLLYLYGECDYQLSRYARLACDQLAQGEEIQKLWFDDYSLDAALAILGQSSLFSATNILWIMSDAKLSKKELEALAGVIQRNESAGVVIQTTHPAAKDHERTVENLGGIAVRFFQATIGEAVAFLREEAAALGLTLSDFLLNRLLGLHENNLSLAVNDLAKLTLIEGEIGIKEIDEVVFGLGSLTIESVLAGLMTNADTPAQLEKLYEQGEEPMAILLATQRYFLQLFAFHRHIKLHGNYDSRAILGFKLPPQIERERAQAAIKITLPTFSSLLELLLRTEGRLKSSKKHDAQAELTAAFITLKELLLASH